MIEDTYYTKIKIIPRSFNIISDYSTSLTNVYSLLFQSSQAYNSLYVFSYD